MNLIGYADKQKLRPAPISIDPRLKIIAFTAITIYLAFLPKTFSLKHLCAIILLIALITLYRPPLKVLAKKSFILIPMLSFLIVLVVIFNNDPVNSKQQIIGDLVLKSTLIFLNLIIFSSAIEFSKLIKALASFRLPSILLSLLFFTQGYLHLFLKDIRQVNIAINCRRSRDHTGFDKIKLMTRLIPHIFLKVLNRGEHHYIAMISRGFQKKIPFINDLHFHKHDLAFTIGFSLLIAVGIFIF